MENKSTKEKINDFIRENMVLVFLIALCIVLAIVQPMFFSVKNLMNAVRQISMLGICACGVSFVMITGNMDISAGAMIGLDGTICAFLIKNAGLPVFPAIVLTLLIGVLCGILNGWLAMTIHISPFVITLGTMQIFEGVAYIICKGLPISGLPESFKFLGQGYVLGFIPVPVIILLIIALISHVLLSRTRMGRNVYALGGNAEATRLAGVNINRLMVTVYAMAGFACALAAVVYAARVNSGIPGAGESYTFDVITASVLGGVSLAGGKGKVSGTIFGVLVIGILANGLVLMDVDSYWQMAIKGAVLLLAVFVDMKKQEIDAKRAIRG